MKGIHLILNGTHDIWSLGYGDQKEKEVKVVNWDQV